jgi:hypothetical protein
MAFNFDTTSNFFTNGVSPSTTASLAKSFVVAGDGKIGGNTFTDLTAAADIGNITDVAFGTNFADSLKAAGLDPSQIPGGLGGGGEGWTFITAPEDVSWDISNQATRVDMFGTNNPPVVAGSRGMRDLTLGNALVEGFVRNVSLEGKISALEQLMNYSLNASDGFVSVPVYQVWANSKSYGGSEAYYIIKDVKIKEKMRDLKGNATRATVDIFLMQVPAYQVNSGRDQASATTAGAGRTLPKDTAANNANQGVQGAPGKGGTSPTNPSSKPAGGANTPAPAPITPRSGNGRFAPLPAGTGR